VPLHPELARETVARVGSEIGLDPVATALAITRTADENMANAIRLVAVERGLDTRDFALMAFGGAGPLQGRAVADRLDMDTVLVPPHPGLCSAFGVGIATASVDRARTFSARSGSVALDRLATAERTLRREAVDELATSVGKVDAQVIRRAALRYEGQNFELEVEIPDQELDAGGWEALLVRFEAEHERHYGFSLPGEPVELINLRATAYVEEATAYPAAPAFVDHEPESRAVWFGDEPVEDCPVLMRESLHPGEVVSGPAVIQEPDSTTLVWPGDSVRVLASGTLELKIGAAE
jgi:N-methylhydantoinase A